MSSTAMTAPTPGQIIESVITRGDLAKLSPEERTRYYSEVCRSVGLNPMTQPFQYLQLNGKLTLYARKDATDQLRQIHGVSLTIASREQVGDVYVVTARATTASGRVDESIGAVSIGSLKGDALANALMKAETKAKRRVTLSICGLGLLDETELETIPNAQPEPMPAPAPKNAPRAISAAPAPVVAAVDTGLIEQLSQILDGLAGYGVPDALILQGIAKMTGQTLTDLSDDSIALLSPQELETLIQRYGTRLNQLAAERSGQPDRDAFDEPAEVADDAEGPRF